MNNPAERRLLTMLFADLSGFTSISQTLDPEELREVIDICFETLNRIITRHGGTIHKYEGDLVIALFGLPHAHEDDPERAVNASLEMIAHVPAINETLSQKLTGPDIFGLHIGINIGTVFAGEIGSAEKKEYTVIGDAVNFASRLKDAAARGEILVSERLFRLTRYLFEYDPLPPLSLKGFNEPVNVFRPKRIKKKPEPKRGIEGLHSPLIGRDTEYGLLVQQARKLNSEKKGGIIHVIGEAGMGKTRLFDELKSHINHEKLPVAVLEGRCLSYGETLAYFPFLRVLKDLFGITDQDPADLCRKKIYDHVTRLFPSDHPDILPYIGLLFSLNFGEELDAKTKYLDAKKLKLQIFVAIKNLLRAESEQRPVFLVIEDYHWIDSTSLDLLEFILDPERPLPLLVMCLSRPDKESAGQRLIDRLQKQYGEEWHEVILQPLNTELGLKLTDHLLSMSNLSLDVKNHILIKAEGNPFFLEEILRSQIDRGFLVFESGTWTATRQLAVSDIPDTIQGVIATRLDKLAPDLKNLLQIAAVIGRSFFIRVLENIAGIDSLMISLHLATLEEFEFVKPLAREPEPEYIFKHPLIQEVAYHSLPIKFRRAMHRQVAETIERLYRQRVDEFSDILAHHYTESDHAAKAIEWLGKAGARAKARYANDEAIKYFQRLIAIAEKAKDPDDILTSAQLDAYENLGDIYRLQASFPSAIRAYEDLYQKGKTGAAQAGAAYKIANVYTDQSDYDNALLRLADAENLVPAGSILHVKCLNIRGYIFRMHGDLEQAGEIYQRSIKLLEKLGDKHELASSFNQLGVVYNVRGDYDRAIEFTQRALAIFEEIGDKQGLNRLMGNMGIFYAQHGDIDRALSCQQKNLAIAEEIGDKRMVGLANNNLSRLYIQREEYSKAEECLRKARDISMQIGDDLLLSAALGNMAILYRGTSQLDLAEENLLQIEAILSRLHNKELLIVTYQQLTEVQLADGKTVDKALAYLEKAMSLAAAVGSKFALAECHQLYTRIYVRLDDVEKAEEHADRAANTYLEIGKHDTYVKFLYAYAEDLNKMGEKDRASLYLEKARAAEKNK